VTGGRLSGFPVLNSALVVLPTPGRALLTHNTTLALDGLMMICEGVCEARGVDLVLNANAQIVVAPGGRLTFTTPMTVHSGAAGAGSMVNAGEMVFASRGQSIVVRVPVLNRGSLIVKDSTDVSLVSTVRQDAPVARFSVESGAIVRKSDGGSLELDTGILQNEGTLYAHVQLGGRFVHTNNAPSSVMGDVVFAPSASVSSHCSSSNAASSCAALNSNGTVYLNGLANFTFDAAAGQSYSLLTAKHVIGSFKDSSSGVRTGGPVYTIAYTPLTATATISSVLQGEPTATISPFYDPASHQSITAVLTPNLAPSPYAVDVSSFASMDTEADMSNMHHSPSSSSPTPDPATDVPDSVLIARNANSTLVISQPIIFQENPEVIHTESQVRVLGMNRSTGEGVLIFFVVLGILALVASSVLLWQWLQLRARLATMQRDSQKASPAVPVVLTTGSQLTPSPVGGSRSTGTSGGTLDSSASPEVLGPGHTLVPPSSMPAVGASQPPKKGLGVRRDSTVTASESENEAEEGKQKKATEI
jgi:hypothetical protein